MYHRFSNTVVNHDIMVLGADPNMARMLLCISPDMLHETHTDALFLFFLRVEDE